MAYPPLPRAAAWHHLQARAGFEVVTVEDHGSERGGLVMTGTTTAVEDGQPWVVSYRLVIDEAWRTREAVIRGRSVGGERSTHLLADGEGRWRIDGVPAEHLTGCLDVDLESSAVTNTLPVHRLGLPVGQSASVPAAYVRALDLRVERLDQTYQRLPDVDDGQRYAYQAPFFDFACDLTYGSDLLVEDYPGLARRVEVRPPG